ncbi:MAG: hypothetical protein F6K21_09275 [Symploca sp. SIO2D2]|nr:hypothetical protein [Symploca sp. SIO2D2]
MKKIAQAMCAIVLTLLTFMIVPMNPAWAVTCEDSVTGQPISLGSCPYQDSPCTQCEFPVEPDYEGPGQVCLSYQNNGPNQETVTEAWISADPLPQKHKLTGNDTTETVVYHTSCKWQVQQNKLFTQFYGNPNVDVKRVDCYQTTPFSGQKLNSEENRKVTPFSLTPNNRTKDLEFDSNLPNKRLTCKNLDDQYEASVTEYNCGFDLDIAPRGYKTQKDYCTSSAITTFSMKPTYTKEVKCRLIEKSFELGIDF